MMSMALGRNLRKTVPNAIKFQRQVEHEVREVVGNQVAKELKGLV